MYFKAICFRPSVNLLCDYEIVFQDSQQSYLQWEWCFGKFLSFTCYFWIVASVIIKSFMYVQMHKLRLETWSSFRLLFESYRGARVVTYKSKKNRSPSNQVGNAFHTLFFIDFARDSQNSVKRLPTACFCTFQIQ